MKKQTKYFTIGFLLLICALLSVTFLPIVIKLFTKLNIQKYIYIQIEFFLLIASSIFYLFSPKYYKWQILTAIVAAIGFWEFVVHYPDIYKQKHLNLLYFLKFAPNIPLNILLDNKV